MPRNAFTLVEMLVVMAILGILVALLVPTLGKGSERARVTACRSNLRQVGLGLRMYLDEHANRFPTLQNRARGTNLAAIQTPEMVLSSYLGAPRVWQCPSDRQRIFEDTGSSYFWNFLVNGQPADRVRIMGLPVSASGFPLFSDKDGFHAALGAARAKNHLYADGAVKEFFILEREP